MTPQRKRVDEHQHNILPIEKNKGSKREVKGGLDGTLKQGNSIQDCVRPWYQAMAQSRMEREQWLLFRVTFS